MKYPEDYIVTQHFFTFQGEFVMRRMAGTYVPTCNPFITASGIIFIETAVPHGTLMIYPGQTKVKRFFPEETVLTLSRKGVIPDTEAELLNKEFEETPQCERCDTSNGHTYGLAAK